MAAAQAADQVVIAVGETREMGGEAEARSNLDLPGRQQELITGDQGDRQAVRGRAVQLPPADALEGRRALARDPRGLVRRRRSRQRRRRRRSSARSTRAASCRSRFPRSVGQIPIYYNHEPTGRPCDPTSKYNSRHRDIASCAPLYEFGYGLSYTTFKVDNLRLSLAARWSSRGSITATVDVTNTGTVAGDDVVQLYIHDPVASICASRSAACAVSSA